MKEYKTKTFSIPQELKTFKLVMKTGDKEKTLVQGRDYILTKKGDLKLFFYK